MKLELRQIGRIPPRLLPILAGRGMPWRRATTDDEPKSVMVLRCDDIGDVLITLPLLRAIRTSWTGAHITVVVKPKVAALLKGAPVIDDVISWEPIERLGTTAVGQLRAMAFAKRMLRRRRFDLAIIARWDIDTYQARSLAVASSARRVVGVDPTSRRSPRWELAERVLLTSPVPAAPGTRHELLRTAEIAQSLGFDVAFGGRPGADLLGPADLDEAARVLSPIRNSALPLVALAVGAGAAKRVWPAERFAAVIRAVAERGVPVAVAVVGGREDRLSARRVADSLDRAVPFVDLTGQLTLKGSLAALGLADLYLGGDTGPMHMACSMSTPTVVVSCHPANGSDDSSNAPSRFGPWGDDSVVVQPCTASEPCTTECAATEPHCILGVDVETVAVALADLIQRLPICAGS